MHGEEGKGGVCLDVSPVCISIISGVNLVIIYSTGTISCIDTPAIKPLLPSTCVTFLRGGDVHVFQGGASPQEVGIHPSDVSVSLRSSLGDSDVQPCKIIFPTRTTLTRGPTSNAVREVQQHINPWPIPVTLLRGLRSISVRVEVSLKKAHPIWVTLKAACG